MSARATKRRSPGEGGAGRTRRRRGSGSASRAWCGCRTAPSKEVNKRGFLTKNGRAEWLGDRQSAGPQGRVHRAEQADVRRLRRGGHRGAAGRPADQGVLPEELAAARRAVPDRAGAARAAHRAAAHHALPAAGEVRPEGPQGGRGPVGEHRPLPAHDRSRRARPGREGRPGAAQPGRRGHAAHGAEAKAPEMHPWDAAQLAAFLGWAR